MMKAVAQRSSISLLGVFVLLVACSDAVIAPESQQDPTADSRAPISNEVPVENPEITAEELANYPGNARPTAVVLSKSTTPSFTTSFPGTAPKAKLSATTQIFGTHVVHNANLSVTGRFTRSIQVTANEMTNQAVQCLAGLASGTIGCSWIGHVMSEQELALEEVMNGESIRYHCGLQATSDGTHGAYWTLPPITFNPGSGAFSIGLAFTFGAVMGLPSTQVTVSQQVCNKPSIGVMVSANGATAAEGDTLITAAGTQNWHAQIQNLPASPYTSFRWTINNAEGLPISEISGTNGPGTYLIKAIVTNHQELSDTASVTLIIPSPSQPPPPPPSPPTGCYPGYYDAGGVCLPDGWGSGGSTGSGGSSGNGPCDPGYNWNGSECEPENGPPGQSELPEEPGSNDPGNPQPPMCAYVWIFVPVMQLWVPFEQCFIASGSFQVRPNLLTAWSALT